MDDVEENRPRLSNEEILSDYRLACSSRKASIVGRREVHSGKAKFGVFGDGKEVAQLALARAFRKGDWRSGYYRDQTWMLALGIIDFRGFFAQLYAHADVAYEPSTGGRAMNAHFASRNLDAEGAWLDQTGMYNSAADVSPTALQMPRTVGLAYASVLYRSLDSLKPFSEFSIQGNEVAWASIGNASTAEGMFWESVNAIGVLHAPAVIAVYDDGFGISVPNRMQMVKEDIHAILKGFERVECPDVLCDRGFDLYSVPAWDYPALLRVFDSAGEKARKRHVPSIIHVTESTQPLGHSTSGSHERYKSPERLAWEAEHDCLPKFRDWILDCRISTARQLEEIEAAAGAEVESAQRAAYEAYIHPIREQRSLTVTLLGALAAKSPKGEEIRGAAMALGELPQPLRRDSAAAAHAALALTRGEDSPERAALASFLKSLRAEGELRYGSELYASRRGSILSIREVPPLYSSSSPTSMGYEVINAAFDAALAREPRLVAFGEDLGKLGDVNQGFRGLQEKYGALRVSDIGIREATILGQAIGMALRGLRPIAEIQYLDYLLYALQIMADDLANLRWRSSGGQMAPVIVRTRGHRLEGIWHSGSPMAGIISLVRGMHVLVPRDFTRAAGFYNSLLKSDDPAIVVEPLNGYRRKERMPDNIGEFCLPLGLPEILRAGEDATVVTYGSTTRIVLEAAERLAAVGIDAEVIDVQTLLPFDIEGRIAQSLKKTSRILFVDEDVPGGATAYMMREVLEKQGGFAWLDSSPRSLPGAEHRPAYGSDGDYWSKPNAESVFDAVYDLVATARPGKFPPIA
jgi:pyruvate/2-oxoglutarate/acetoin dehydrogenase E1 component/TPP-dependent pyruvate/acetoin dehydrogenase alpha subunit